MKIIAFSFIFLPFLLGLTSSVGSNNHGSADINIEGGKIGDISFPHRKHQSSGIDCSDCHFMFPQEKHSIKELINSGNLAKKHVMNRLCIACHKNMKSKKNKTGPTACKSCHLKPQSIE